MIWFTSDLHFYHQNVLRLGRGRPFQSLQHMHDELISRWNKRVRPQDHVYVLGDFSFGNKPDTESILSKLNGRKTLVTGNHDKDAHYMLSVGFYSVVENIYIKMTHNNTKMQVYLSHFPYYPSFWQRLWARLTGGFIDRRYLHKRIVNRGDWLLHGHTHSPVKVRGKSIHVGVDAWDYRPVSQTEILQIIQGGRNGRIAPPKKS